MAKKKIKNAQNNKNAKNRTTKNKSKRGQSPQKRFKKRTLFKALFKWGFIAGIWGIIALCLILGWYGAELPQITQSVNFTRKHTIIIQSADGTIIARRGEIKGTTVALKDLPSYVPGAVIAIEDRRFYQHPGVDLLGIARAMGRNVLSGSVRQGGSTLTQQLAKNLFLSADRTLKRKIQEAMLALWLESKLSKDEIIEAYLNRVYMGGGAYGIDAAAKLYFKIPAQDLTLGQAAQLAGLLKAPSRLNPRANPDAAQKRQRVVLHAMQSQGLITKEQEQSAAFVTMDIDTSTIRAASSNIYGYFTDYVAAEAADIIGPVNQDVIITTTLSQNLQQAAQTALEDQLLNNDRAITQGAALFMQQDGAILSMIGGINYSQSQFNRATQARRQPGSAFKPIVALTALEEGWSPDHLILDAPFTEDDEYQPENFAQDYAGETTLNDALTHSKNTAFVRVMQETGGPHKTMQTARKLGIKSTLNRDLSLALGSSALSLQELVSAYSIFANGGYALQPYSIIKITDMDGNIIYEHKRRKKSSRLFERSTIEELDTMLQSVVANGTGRGAQISGIEIRGKTGTSQDYRDAWFIAYTDKVTGGIWLGNDDNTPMDHVTGGSLPARIWKQSVQATHAQLNAKPYGASDSFFGDLIRSLTSGNAEPEISQDFDLNQ